MKECCSTCANNCRIRKSDYSQEGCRHSDVEGYACLVCADEGVVFWMIGNDPNSGLCEGYTPNIQED
jgi:hypothetical protein